VGVGVGEEQSRAVVRRGGAQDSAQHGVYAPAPPCKASKHVCAGPYAPPSGGEEKEWKTVRALDAPTAPLHPNAAAPLARGRERRDKLSTLNPNLNLLSPSPFYPHPNPMTLTLHPNPGPGPWSWSWPLHKISTNNPNLTLTAAQEAQARGREGAGKGAAARPGPGVGPGQAGPHRHLQQDHPHAALDEAAGGWCCGRAPCTRARACLTPSCSRLLARWLLGVAALRTPCGCAKKEGEGQHICTFAGDEQHHSHRLRVVPGTCGTRVLAAVPSHWRHLLQGGGGVPSILQAASRCTRRLALLAHPSQYFNPSTCLWLDCCPTGGAHGTRQQHGPSREHPAACGQARRVRRVRGGCVQGDAAKATVLSGRGGGGRGLSAVKHGCPVGAAETTPLSAPLGSLLRGDYHDLHCKFQTDKRARALFEAPAKDNDLKKKIIWKWKLKSTTHTHHPTNPFLHMVTVTVINSSHTCPRCPVIESFRNKRSK